MNSWFGPAVVAAVISAIISLGTLWIKDWLIANRREAKQKQETQNAVYFKYAGPLSASAEELFWRLKEIFSGEGRSQFLLPQCRTHSYDHYKFDSTLYRLAAVLGWLRAYRLELLILSVDGKNESIEFKEAISSLVSSLADGHHIEDRRIQAVADLWKVELSEDLQVRRRTAVSIERISKALLGANAQDLSDLSVMDDYKKDFLCREVYAALKNSESKEERLPEYLLLETRQDVIRSLSHREAWLYRDYQRGIGDMMIQPLSGGPRLYNVLGFKSFENLLSSDDVEVVRWITRLRSVFDGIDIEAENVYDARFGMLQSVHLSLRKLLLSLHQQSPDRTPVSEAALNAAKSLLSAQEASCAK